MNGTFPDEEATSLQLVVQLVLQVFLIIAINEALAEATDRGGVRHFVMTPEKGNKLHKENRSYRASSSAASLRLYQIWSRRILNMRSGG